MKHVSKIFESTLQMQRYLSQAKTSNVFCLREKNNNLASMRLKSEYKGSIDFYSTEDLKTANDLLLFGDKERMKLLDKSFKQITSKGSGTSVKRKTYADVVGFMPHVPNAIMGLPFAMINERKVQVKNSKIINVLWCPAVSWKVRAEDLAEHAAKVLSACYNAEKQGYRCNIYVVCSANNGRRKDRQCVTMITKVKDAGQPMDLLKCVYPMTNPDFLRRHFFRFIETQDGVSKVFADAYGYAETNLGTFEDSLPHGFKVDYCFNFANTHYDVSLNKHK